MGDFEEFWKHYPRKVKKDYAKIMYLKTIKQYDEKKLLKNVVQFAIETKEQKKDEQYIPHCSTWLNQKQYLDYNEVKVIKRKSLNAIAG